MGDNEEGELWAGMEIRDRDSPRPCAVRILRESDGTKPLLRQRFLRETRLARVLRHPNIVRIFDSGECEGVTYVAREYVDGVSLRQVLDRVPDVFENADLVAQLALRVSDALSYTHTKTNRRGVPSHLIHGRLCPSAILIAADGTPKVTPMALSRLEHRPLRPMDGGRTGAPGYQSPEQFRGRAANSQSDVFSLGVILTEMLGRGPLSNDGRPPRDLANLVAERCALHPDMPAPFKALLLRMTALSRTLRPNDAGALRRELEKFTTPKTDLEEGLSAALTRAAAPNSATNQVVLPPFELMERELDQALAELPTPWD